MDFYHGTIVGGIKELTPYANPDSNLKEPLVYLTTSKQLALHYIMDRVNRIGSSPMLNIRQDGVLVFQEMFSGALEHIYKGLSGYIYHCVGSYHINTEAKVHTCATSSEPVPVTDVEFIPDVYERIIEYGKYGMFVYEKYEDLPRHRHDIIRGWVLRWLKDSDIPNNPEHPEYKIYQERWPLYLKEAEVLRNNGLL